MGLWQDVAVMSDMCMLSYLSVSVGVIKVIGRP